MNIKAIIVDDEAPARNVMRQLLEEFCPEVEILDEATNIKEAVKLINKLPVELVFLDVDMPEENGFALFDYYDAPAFDTIFCTAHANYAVKAFEVSAMDFLLKPINVPKLQAAVEKVIRNRHQNQISQRIASLKENLQSKRLQKIGLPLSDALEFVVLDDIFYFEADGSYTNVFTKEGKVLVSKKIKYFEDILLDDGRFVRTHRSYLVNVENVVKYSKKEGATLAFPNGLEVPVAREKVKEFDDSISGLKL